MIHIIGEISINLSLFIYFIWFVPQLYLNFKRKNTDGLSMWMHGLLCIGYISDLMYGFGRHMQWQYRAVTIIGLISLSLQHYQFGRYGLHRKSQSITYIALSLFYFILFCFAFYNVDEVHRNKQFYDIAGMISNFCWLTYVIPQIVKNFVNKSTEGLSTHFVILSIFISLCDTVSAWALGWDYPSKIGAPLTVAKKSILLFQLQYYRGSRLHKLIKRPV